MSFPLLLRRSAVTRHLVLMVQAAAVLCQLAEGSGRVHCPHHDLVPSQPMAGMNQGMGRGMDDGTGTTHHRGPAGHACTCLGECCTAAGALPSSQLPAFAVATSRQLPALLTRSIPAFLLEARQPPSTGPPLST